MMFAVPPSLSTLSSQDDYDGPVMSTCDDENGESTQEMTQTQPVDYAPPAAERFDHLWGRLIPASPQVKRLDFDHSKDEYTIGRGLNVDYTLTGSNRISTIHIQFKYLDNTVFLTDLSMNGTYLNGKRVKKGVRHMVTDRDEISLGSPSDVDGLDYRFIFKSSNGPDPLVGGGIHERYQVGEKIGSGAFATVCKGVNLLTSELVAIKVIVKSKFAKDKDRNLLLFERERTIVSRLKHHGVVNYLDYFEDDMSIFLVMELVSGGDLMDYINTRLQSGGHMEEAEAQRLTRGMCGALAYLHQQGVVHRDLKPENVLLTSDDPPQAKIADFGLSKAIDSQTFLRTMCGTPAYLAPEVVLNDGGYTALVDSWSLGVIVFAMLSATMPFVPNETQDLKTSLKLRVVLWEYLPGHISDLCRHWISLMINRDTNVRMNMVLALQHEWLRDDEYEMEQSYSQETYSQMYPNEAAEIRNPPSTSSSSACISPDTRDPTPETPFQYASGLDDCSQDLGNLRINSDNPSLCASDADSLNIGPGAADYFPSVPAIHTHIPYPPHSSKTSENDVSGMNPLRSAWLPGPIGGARAPASEDSDLITPDGKRKLRSSPSRPLSPVLSERSSSPLSSVPSESEMTVTPQKEKKKKVARDPPAHGRRVSLRILNRGVRPGTNTAAPQTPPPAPARVKRRRLTSTGNATGQAPSTRGRPRSSSVETAKSHGTTRRTRRS